MDPINKRTQVANLITHACCTCKKFFPLWHSLDPVEEYDLYTAEGQCLEKEGSRLWIRGYFGCRYHETHITNTMKMVAQKGNIIIDENS